MLRSLSQLSNRPINGTIQVAPLASDFDVCFVNAPRPADGKGKSAPALPELRSIVPDPTHDGRMCQREATLCHHLHQVAQAQFEPKVPAHAQKDDLEVEVASGGPRTALPGSAVSIGASALLGFQREAGLNRNSPDLP